MDGDVFKGVKVTSEVNGDGIIQYVLMQERMDNSYTNEDLSITFKGQFAVLTLAEGRGPQSMYLGSGHELTYGEHTLAADGTSNAAYRAF